jgi:hypothetical protein
MTCVQSLGKDVEIQPYADGLEHLAAELGVVLHLLHREVGRMTRRFEAEMVGSFKMYGITPSEAMEHLQHARAGSSGDAEPVDPELVATINRRVEVSLARGVALPLVRLGHLFRLSRFEVTILLTCLLPEFYPGLGRVLGFLQDDATLTYPTLGYLMTLYCRNWQERKAAWQSFHPGSPLRTWRLLAPAGDAERQPPLRRSYRVEERIVAYLMGSDRYDGALEGCVIPWEVRETRPVGERRAVLESIIGSVRLGRECTLVSLTGADREGAIDFAKAAARELGWRLFGVPASTLVHQREWHLGRIDCLLREAVLQPAVILLTEDAAAGEALPDPSPFLRSLARRGMLAFFLGGATLVVDGIHPPIHHLKLTFKGAAATERVKYWEEAIARSGLSWPAPVAEQLAMRYAFSQERVDTMFHRLTARLNGDPRDAHPLELFNDLMNDYGQRPLDELAQRVDPVFQWNDLVVHRSLADHLKAFRNTIAHQFTVYERWRLGDKIPRGRGVVALFSGPSGAGKTMAAETIAHDLGMNLYRIDLAGVVSKYIGETEKNIKKIFDSARGTNTLLFFDEADALFGRRTEIRDSHDRYANLEVNYLLQRLEEHDGPVILATNRRKNMDEAFLRRIHFIIEFSLPTEPLRQLIWQKYLPPTLPRAGDVDVAFLAKHFEVSGGDIKNAALQAAFLAAEDGQAVSMPHLLAALRREYLKLGKVFPGSQVQHLGGTGAESPGTRRRRKEVSRGGA